MISISPEAAAAAAVAAGAAKAVLGPASNELGEPFRIVVRKLVAPLVRRLENREATFEQVFEKAADHLRERGVPQSRLKQPADEVLAQTLFGTLLTGGQPDLSEMFAGLLATAMDEKTAPLAHPACCETLRHMSGDDARFFRYLATSCPIPVRSTRAPFGEDIVAGLFDGSTERATLSWETLSYLDLAAVYTSKQKSEIFIRPFGRRLWQAVQGGEQARHTPANP